MPADDLTQSGHPPADRRRPRSVYGVGTEPDPRFTLANERTFLAWIRTALACMAAGIAFDAFVADVPEPVRDTISIAIVAIGIACVMSGYRRWMRNERALRLSEPLSASVLAMVLGVVFVAVGLVLVASITVWV